LSRNEKKIVENQSAKWLETRRKPEERVARRRGSTKKSEIQHELV
jgi:hypothetical protein